MSKSIVRVVLVMGWAVLWLALTGCSSHEPKQPDQVEKDLYLIAQAFDLHMADRHRPPRDEADLVSVIKDIIEGRDARDPSEILRSPRDGQPFVIVYGSRIDSDAHDTLLAHEKDGVDGTRYVLSQAGYVRVMTKAEFANAKLAKSTNPRSRTNTPRP